jgi:DNA-binding transcriptional LysR family regulator
MDQEAYSELSLRELRVLYALLQQRSITRTAQAMETTQPAISKMLGRLIVVLERTSRGAATESVSCQQPA